MNVTGIAGATQATTLQVLYQAISASRFTATITEAKGANLKIQNVRLKEARDKKRPNHLEGVDWVEFNDTLNNALDRAGIHANIESITVIVRRGAYRRDNYEKLVGEWDKAGNISDYKNNVGGNNLVSTFPKGAKGAYVAIGYYNI